jgi:hypothetical protein
LTNDTNATLRRISVDGTHLYASCGYPWDESGASDEILAFDTTQPLAGQTPAVFHAQDDVQNFVVRNGWAYVAGDTNFVTVDLSTGTAHPVTGHTPGGTFAVAVSGTHAFVAARGASGDNVLQIYDVSNPASPQFVRELAPFESGSQIWGLRLLDANRLLVFEPRSPNYGRVDIVNIADVSNVSVIGGVDVSDATDGFVSGNTLYVTGDWDGISLVDIANPAAPLLLSTVYTLGPSIGVTVVKPNLIAVATGTAGLTFVDVSDRTHPVIKGTQQVPGSPEDVFIIGNTIYAAAETCLDALRLP